MIKHQFSQFSYAVNNDSAKKGKKEILVCFMYNGTEVLKKVYIPEKAGTAYIFEAKKIIDQEMRDGTLSAYAHKFVAKNKKKDASNKPKTASSNNNKKPEYVPVRTGSKGLKIAFIIVCILLVAAVALAIFFMLKKDEGGTPSPTPTPTTEKVAVTFDAGEGSWSDKSHAKTYTIDKGKTWADITKPEEEPKIESGKFNKWTINGGEPESYVFNANTTVVANYNTTEFKLTFDAGEGTWTNQADDRTITVKYGTQWKEIKNEPKIAVTAPVGEKFVGFSNGTEILTDYYTFTDKDKEVEKYVAQYEPADPTEVMVTIDPGEGTFAGGISETIVLSEEKGTTWANIIGEHPVTPPAGHSGPTWEYCNGVDVAEWTPVPAEGLTINEPTNFRATYTTNVITFAVDRGLDGVWTDGTGAQSKSFDVEYGTLWSDFLTTYKDYVAITANSGKVFSYFSFGDDDDDIVGPSYAIDGTSLHAVYGNSSEARQITLNAGTNGTIGGANSVTVYIPYGKTWGQVKNAFTPTVNHDVEYTTKFDYFTYHDSTSGDDVQFPDNSVISADSPGTLTAHYSNIGAADFATDSWSVIAREANEGVDHLKAVYGNDFASKTRTVNLFGKDYTVKVIGTDADTIDEGNKATLTFEFQDVITKGVSYINYGAEVGEYETSNLRTYLNGSLYNSLPDDLKAAVNLKTNKLTYKYNGTTVSPTQDALFPLSLSEMGYTQDPQGTTVQNEGTVYTGYSVVAKSATAYWTRSPAPEHAFAAWGIDSDGQLGHEGSLATREAFEMTYGLGVAPAFTIGSHS